METNTYRFNSTWFWHHIDLILCNNFSCRSKSTEKQIFSAAVEMAAQRLRQQQRGCGGSMAAEAAALVGRVVIAALLQYSGRGSSAAAVTAAVVAAAAMLQWRHSGGGGGGGSPITHATVLPIPLIIAAARLGNVAVSLCGLRGGGGLLGGSSSLNADGMVW